MAKPLVRSFNTVLAIWSKSEAPHAPERAEAVLHRLHQLNKTKALDVKPDKYSSTAILFSLVEELASTMLSSVLDSIR